MLVPCPKKIFHLKFWGRTMPETPPSFNLTAYKFPSLHSVTTFSQFPPPPHLLTVPKSFVGPTTVGGGWSGLPSSSPVSINFLPLLANSCLQRWKAMPTLTPGLFYLCHFFSLLFFALLLHSLTLDWWQTWCYSDSVYGRVDSGYALLHNFDLLTEIIDWG